MSPVCKQRRDLRKYCRYIVKRTHYKKGRVCRSPNIDRMIKSRRLRWAVNVARMEEGRSAFKILTGKLTGKRPF